MAPDSARTEHRTSGDARAEREALLTEGRAAARGARFLDEETALAEAVLTWKMVTLVLGFVTAVCVAALVVVAVRPRPAYITHLEDRVYVADEVRDDDVKAFARAFVDRIATLRPDEKALDRHILEASRYVHPRFLEPWLTVARDLKFEVLTNRKTSVFDPIEAAVRAEGSHWVVRIFGTRKRFLGDESVGPETGCCYELVVDRVRPTASYPRPLTIARVAQPTECSQVDFDAAAGSTAGTVRGDAS